MKLKYTVIDIYYNKQIVTKLLSLTKLYWWGKPNKSTQDSTFLIVTVALFHESHLLQLRS